MLRWEWNSYITTVTLLVCWGRGHQECICCICQQMSWKRLLFKYSIYFSHLFMKCDAEGYCYDYWPYMGKHDLFHERSLGERVVKHLCRPLKYNGHHVIFDRFLMKTTIWLTKIEIYSFPVHFMLNVYMLHHVSYFWHNFKFFTSISLVRTLLDNGYSAVGQ